MCGLHKTQCGDSLISLSFAIHGYNYELCDSTWNVYSCLDGFSECSHILMAVEDRAKTTFIIAWEVFVCTIMRFGLQYALTTFQRERHEIFGVVFMRVFWDNLSVFGTFVQHLEHLLMCFQHADKCLLAWTLWSVPLRYELGPHCCGFG